MKNIKFKLDGKKINWPTTRPILTKGSGNIKLNKSEKFGTYSTMGLHLAPADMSGYNVCPNASDGCKKVCLTYSGQGQMYKQGEMYTSNIHVARIAKTILLKKNRRLFFQKLKTELNRAELVHLFLLLKDANIISDRYSDYMVAKFLEYNFSYKNSEGEYCPLVRIEKYFAKIRSGEQLSDDAIDEITSRLKKKIKVK